MPRLIGYIRVSTDDQVESGAGAGGQLAALRALAARKGVALVGPFEESEGLSGATPFEDCPALMAAVGSLERGDWLVVSRRDRLARDRTKILMFESFLKTRGCRLVSASGEGTDADDPDDLSAMLMRGIVDLFAEYERLVTKFRTRAGLQSKRRAGDRVGRVPYGFDLVDDGRRSKRGMKDGVERAVKLVPNADEQSTLSLMRWLRDERGLTYRRIAEHLNFRAMLTKAGKPWAHTSVRHVLTNPHPMNHAHAHQDEASEVQSPSPDPPAVAG